MSSSLLAFLGLTWPLWATPSEPAVPVSSAPPPENGPEHEVDESDDAEIMTSDLALLDLEAAFLGSLKVKTGVTFEQWMDHIDGVRAGRMTTAARNAVIDDLRQRGFSFSEGAWLERVAARGRRPVYVPGDLAPVERKIVRTDKLCVEFVTWMRGEGRTGYWLVAEIDRMAKQFCDIHGFAVPGHYEFRSHLACTPGVKKGMYRIKGNWEFAAVARRTKMERPTLYRISNTPVAEAFQDNLEMSRDAADDCRLPADVLRMPSGRQPEDSRKGSGKQPKGRRKSTKNQTQSMRRVA
jgi:hypothetical protein